MIRFLVLNSFSIFVKFFIAQTLKRGLGLILLSLFLFSSLQIFPSTIPPPMPVEPLDPSILRASTAAQWYLYCLDKCSWVNVTGPVDSRAISFTQAVTMGQEGTLPPTVGYLHTSTKLGPGWITAPKTVTVSLWKVLSNNPKILVPANMTDGQNIIYLKY